MIKAGAGFLKNSGLWVMASGAVAKLFSFLMMLFLIRYLPMDEFGILTVALNFINFFIPALGFGSSHGFLRFGAAVSEEKREELAQYSLMQGMLFQLLLSLLVIAITVAFHYDQKTVLFLTIMMVVRMFGLFFLEQAKAELRASFNNKKFAQVDIVANVLSIILGVVFTLQWGITGYVVSLCIFPFSVFLMHRFRFKKVVLPGKLKRIFWNYAVKSVLTAVVFIWTFLLDVFFVGRYFNSDEVGFYKMSVLLPMNLIFIAQVYTQTLYPELCRNYRKRQYLVSFVKNYYSIFVPVTAVFVGLGFLFDEELLMLFGSEKTDTSILRVMYLQMASIILLRVPFGNLMAAMGNIGASLAIGVFIMCGICIASVILLPGGTPLTEAYISFIFITLGGALAGFYFLQKFNKLRL